MNISRSLYSKLLYVSFPFTMLYLLKRARKQSEYKDHWGERFAFGHFPVKTEGKKRIWIHAVSVGETRASIPLVEMFLNERSDTEVLYTHTTPTGREVGAQFAKKYPGRIFQSYLPYDTAKGISKFIKETQPNICLLMETEVWPNLTFYTKKFDVPTILVNARLSERSLKRAQKVGTLLSDAMGRLTMALAQSEADKVRLEKAGAKYIEITGNLKFDFSINEEQQAKAASVKQSAKRPIVMLASTRDGEEKKLIEAIKSIKSITQRPVQWLVVPRHPQRFNEVKNLIKEAGFTYESRSEIKDWDKAFDKTGPEVIVGDSMGEMAFYYGIADVVIMGGSFGNYGSQSPIEPIAMGVPVIIGPSTFNFQTIVKEAQQANAVLRVKDEAEAVQMALNLLSDKEKGSEISENAKSYYRVSKGATKKSFRTIEKYLGESSNDPRAS